jgi:hypothetical protein
MVFYTHLYENYSGEINKFISTIEAAKFLNCARSTLGKYIKLNKNLRAKFQINLKFED